MTASGPFTLAIGPSGVDQLRLYKIDHPQPLVPFTRAQALATAAAQLLGE